MILYQLVQDKILEYKITRTQKETVEYKRKAIDNSKIEFYGLKTTNPHLVQKVKLGENIDSGYYLKNENDTEDRKFASLVLEPEMAEKQEQILNNYINGSLRNPLCIKFENMRPRMYQQDYFLLSQNTVEQSQEGYYMFPNMWKMPLELAGITLLEQKQHTKFLEDERLIEAFPAELYQAWPINEYDAKFLHLKISGIEQMGKVIKAQEKIINKIKTK